MEWSRDGSLANQMSWFMFTNLLLKRPVLFSAEFWERISLNMQSTPVWQTLSNTTQDVANRGACSDRQTLP
jgi:hypothetical protein